MTSTGNFFFDFAARKRNIFSRPDWHNSLFQYLKESLELWAVESRRNAKTFSELTEEKISV